MAFLSPIVFLFPETGEQIAAALHMSRGSRPSNRQGAGCKVARCKVALWSPVSVGGSPALNIRWIHHNWHILTPCVVAVAIGTTSKSPAAASSTFIIFIANRSREPPFAADGNSRAHRFTGAARVAWPSLGDRWSCGISLVTEFASQIH